MKNYIHEVKNIYQILKQLSRDILKLRSKPSSLFVATGVEKVHQTNNINMLQSSHYLQFTVLKPLVL